MTALGLIEIRTHSVPRAQGFYEHAFDWTLRRGGAGIPALLIDSGVAPLGFLLQVPPAIPLTVCPYLLTNDCAKAAATSEALGGQTLIEREDAGGLGMFSLVIDPWGNHVARLEADPVATDTAATQNHFCWMDLRAPNLEQAVEHYSELDGVTFSIESPTYAIGYDASGQPAWGLRQDTRDLGPLIYVAVADLPSAVAQVIEHGGAVVEEHTELPTLGDAALITDPDGNYLALLQRSQQVDA